MSPTRILAILLFLIILGGTFALSEPGDLDILARVSRVSLDHAKSALPPNDTLTGPLAAFRAGDALPIEERVRLRIQTDKDLAGAEVTVVSTSPGQIRLKGVVTNSVQKARAVEIAERTAGVQSVIEELALPQVP